MQTVYCTRISREIRIYMMHHIFWKDFTDEYILEWNVKHECMKGQNPRKVWKPYLIHLLRYTFSNVYASVNKRNILYMLLLFRSWGFKQTSNQASWVYLIQVMHLLILLFRYSIFPNYRSDGLEFALVKVCFL